MRGAAGIRRRASIIVLLGVGLLASAPGGAMAAAPTVAEEWSAEVAARSARLFARLQLDPVRATQYHFNYISRKGYEANLSAGKGGFSGAATVPAADAQVAAGPSQATVAQAANNLAPEMAYLFRIVATNSSGVATGLPEEFITQPLGGAFSLPDGRGWEMVSPIDKNGGQVDGPGEVAGGGAFQAAADGSSVTFSSRASFGAAAQGAPPGSQYVSHRRSDGWATENVTTPVVSGSYGSEPTGVPYQLFSADLRYALMLNGRPCRGEGTGCPVANPPLPGSGAPSGYQNYYLRDDAAGSFRAVLTAATLASGPLAATEFEVALAGATPDLAFGVVSTCAAIGPSAAEVPAGEGCDAGAQNLYLFRRSDSSIIPVNLLPSDSVTTPGAALAAPGGAISTDGSRVYFYDQGGLYVRNGSTTDQLDDGLGGGGEFQVASADGAVAYFTKAEHLYRFDLAGGSPTDLTPAGGVNGVLGASADGAQIYYLTDAGLFRRQGLVTTPVAGDAGASNYPPATGTGRVSDDGLHLLFLSSAELTGFDNLDAATGLPDVEVYLYDAVPGRLTCVSCNPTKGRPIGSSTVPGATRNGAQVGAVEAYKPRVLSADGNRVIFDSDDALAVADTNAAPDVYQWERNGTGDCARAAGCISLLSSGKSLDGAHLVDASLDGGDVFFRTDGSLVPSDPGSIDLYDARIGGGFPEAVPPIPCQGDACQSLPSEPEDPVVNTLIEGRGNPAVHFFDTNRHKPRYRRFRDHHHKRAGKRRHSHAGKRRGADAKRSGIAAGLAQGGRGR